MKLGPSAFARTFLAATAAAILSASPAAAQTVIVDEDFESYADLTALNAVWPNTNDPNGRLVDETFTEFLTFDDIEPQDVGARAFPEGGQGFEHAGQGYVEIDVAALHGDALFPSETESIVLEGDIFDTGALGNKRMSIGLRSNAPENLIELGFWNEELGFDEVVGYSHRAILFPATPEDPNPNWAAFDLPIELDRADDADDVVTVGDIGEDWHRYRVVVTPETLTYEIDLRRDGINNGTGAPGVDASVTYEVATGPNGYDSLRIGAPSGVSSAGNNFYGGVIFDNIYLALEPASTGGVEGDANGDGAVDLLDLDILGQQFGVTSPGLSADFNEDGTVDLLDLDILGQNFGTGSATAVPEPTAAFLAALALSAAALRGRRA